MDVAAEQRIDVLYADGGMATACIRVGLPRPHPRGDFACPVTIEGLRGREGTSELFGVSSLQALVLGLRFLHRLLAIEVGRGSILRWEGGEEVLDPDLLFAVHKPA